MLEAYPKRTLIFLRQEKNRLPTVARVLSATLADSTGKFETLGSNFRHEIRFSEAAAVHCYSIRSLILFRLKAVHLRVHSVLFN